MRLSVVQPVSARENGHGGAAAPSWWRRSGRRGHDIDRYPEAARARLRRGGHRLRPYDLIVYQFGNSVASRLRVGRTR